MTKPRFTALLIVLLSVGVASFAETVVILNSYHPGFSWSDGIVDGIRAGLADRDVEHYVEYLDTKRYPYEPESARIEKLADYLSSKYQAASVDVVMTTDDNALAFYLDYGDTIFKDTPVVFAGVNHLGQHRVAGNHRITGVTEADNHSLTVEMILSIHPGIETIYVVTDSTTSGRGNRQKFEAVASRWSDRVGFQFLNSSTNLTFEGLLLKMRALPDDAVVLFRDFFVDSTGDYLSPERLMSLLSAAAPVPVYAFGDMYLGHGITGGVLTLSKEHGLIAAELAGHVLDGIPPSGIPIRTDGIAQPTFDYQQLERFGVARSDLPPGSRVYGRPRTLYRDYATPFWLMAVSIVGLALLSTVLGVSVQRLRRLREENIRTATFLHATLESMGEGLVTVDPDHRITDMNAVAEELTGTDLADASGRKLHAILKAHGDEWSTDIDSLLERIVHLEHSIRAGDDEYFEPKDGSGRRLSYSGAPIRGHGEALGVVLTIRDVTEMHTMVRTLEESERRLVRSQSVAHVGSWEYDPRSKMLWGSAEFYRVLGIETDEPSIASSLVTALILQEDRSEFIDAVNRTIETGEILERDFRAMRASDHEVRFLKARAERSRRSLVLGTIQDITESTITRSQLEDSLAEKEVLLREVHHRVKNNMQVISSLINLQQSNAGEKPLKEVLMDSQNRIRSMALIHDMLYQSDTFTEIDLEPYLRSLSVTLFDAFDVGRRGVKIEFDTESVSVGLDQAIPCGLMTNEIVSNSLKYAFNGSKSGTISVGLKRRNRKIHLRIHDDGCGLPNGVEPGTGSSLGMQLIGTLADQMHAQIRVDRSEGTAWSIDFESEESAKDARERVTDAPA